MPIDNYGVLKGKPIEVRLGTSKNAHYQVRLVDDTTDYRIAINVRSAMAPSEVEYLVIENYRHPVIERAHALPLGFTPLPRTPASGALDYIRDNLFDRAAMKPLPFDVPGADNDLNEKIDRVMQRAIGDENAIVYAFGEPWGPEPDKKDKFFAFVPGNGIHNIHMNQGNVGRFREDDGVRQDGALFIHFPDQDEWIAVFLKFQSQAWHTDDVTGSRIVGVLPGYPFDDMSVDPSLPAAAPSIVALPDEDEPHGMVRIVAALVNTSRTPEVETITLLNRTAHRISLDGWTIVDTGKGRIALSGAIAAGATVVVEVHSPNALSNRGGTITLLNEAGLKVDGVAYTGEQARHPGWTLVF